LHATQQRYEGKFRNMVGLHVALNNIIKFSHWR